MESSINHQRLPDGTNRIIATNDSGALHIEKLGDELRLSYERTFPQLKYMNLAHPILQHAALIDLGKRRRDFDQSIANDLLRQVHWLLNDNRQAVHQERNWNARATIFHKVEGTTWMVAESKSASRGSMTVKNGNEAGNVAAWLQGTVEDNAIAVNSAIGNIGAEWEQALQMSFNGQDHSVRPSSDAR